MAFTGPMSDISEGRHALLDPPSPAYSHVTVRRAFIVWMYCGQRNKFKDVCNYFHYLEALEEKLSAERRARSRHYEFNLFSNKPPTSNYLMDHFPQLYKEQYHERHISKVEEIRNEKCVFKLEGFHEISPRKGTTTQEIVEVSRMIRKYCRIQMLSLKNFLEEFKQHASKCDLNYTVTNIALYIKRKMVQAEIELEANYPKTLGFLNSSRVENIFDDMHGNTVTSDIVENDAGGSVDRENVANAINGIKPVKILRKENANDTKEPKNYRNRANTMHAIGNNIPEIWKPEQRGHAHDNNSIFLINETITLNKTKAASIEDLSNAVNVLKKERKFSGSRFMKVELEKFRKI